MGSSELVINGGGFDDLMVNGQAQAFFVKEVGATNVIDGTFTTGNTSGQLNVDVPYNGNGYIIGLFISPVGGASTVANKSGVNGRVFCGLWKYDESTAPTYTGEVAVNACAYVDAYKHNSAGAISTSDNQEAYLYSTMSMNSLSTEFVRIRSSKMFTVYVRSNTTSASVGLFNNTEWHYRAIYSE